MTLVLFDIDGTLVRGAPPFHRQALCDAARVVFGVALAPVEFGPTAGMTDRAIARRELLAAGVSDTAISEGLADFCAAAATAYAEYALGDLTRYQTPSVTEALDWLLEMGATIGLVTGNIERIAWRKLSAAGLAARFLLPSPQASGEAPMQWIGGFGDQGEDRAELPPLALARAQRLLGQRPHPRATWIIGDTPADIACGAAHGLRTIAVATGVAHSHADLQSCNPEATLRALSELPSLTALSAALNGG